MTITPSPSSVPQTPTLSIPTPSTLDPESAATLQGFPSDIEECEHPCWNGLTPGSSGGLLVPAFFASLGIDFTTLPNIEVNSTEGLLGTYSFFRRNELDTALEMIEVTWSDKVELIQLWYTRSPNLLGEDAFLHPELR